MVADPVWGMWRVPSLTVQQISFCRPRPLPEWSVLSPLGNGHGSEHLLSDGTDLLIGLVVRNGIMLLDFSERLHADGEPFESALAHAGRIRLRPILMTTFYTLFGLLPLALGLGAGAELQKPLALAVGGGLVLSTPVTLLAVPGLYAAVRRRR
jgi:hypothetical protein